MHFCFFFFSFLSFPQPNPSPARSLPPHTRGTLKRDITHRTRHLPRPETHPPPHSCTILPSLSLSHAKEGSPFPACRPKPPPPPPQTNTYTRDTVEVERKEAPRSCTGTGTGYIYARSGIPNRSFGISLFGATSGPSPVPRYLILCSCYWYCRCVHYVLCTTYLPGWGRGGTLTTFTRQGTYHVHRFCIHRGANRASSG